MGFIDADGSWDGTGLEFSYPYLSPKFPHKLSPTAHVHDELTVFRNMMLLVFRCVGMKGVKTREMRPMEML